MPGRGFPVTGRNDAEGEAARALAEQRTGKIYVRKFIGFDSLRFRWELATREEVGSVEWARSIMEAFERENARKAARSACVKQVAAPLTAAVSAAAGGAATKAARRLTAAPNSAKAKKGSLRPKKAAGKKA
jgi:hypothetical protein